MKYKKCFTCGEEKPVYEFYLKKNGKHEGSCRVCKNAYMVEYYKKNPDKYQEKLEMNKRYMRDYMREYRRRNRR